MAKNLKRKSKSIVKKVVTAYNVISTVYLGCAFLKSRGTKKENDGQLILKAIDTLSGSVAEPDSIITIDETEMHVSYNPYMHLFTNSIGCIAGIMNGTTDVYTDNTFRKLSKKTQMFVLAHELGHHKYEHKPGFTYQIDRFKATIKGQVLDIELEADEFAAEYIRDKYLEKYGYDYDNYNHILKLTAKTVINCLEELSKYTTGLARKELLLRAKPYRTLL